MTLYFAYGSNLNIAQMRARCPGSPLVGRARLSGWRVAMVSPGYAGILPTPDGVVEGALYRLTEDDEATLDIHEGVPTSYTKQVLTVAGADGIDVAALVYVQTTETAARVRKPGYVERILQGAADQALPAEYLAALERWLDLPVDPGTPTRSFVACYGTLRLGERNWARFLRSAEHLGCHRVAGFALYDHGAWPYAVPGTESDAITVDLFAVDETTMYALDALEGYPNHYDRRSVSVAGRDAWIYWIAAAPSGTRRIASGDWLSRP